eukprot:TRINITY_DN9300_c0_g1_i1.p1 TRINITY_DN9300_c0_g1~~TRINITY_DN9300_c0_g1_i1.p1  ORF type:complete len:410 (-),score=72.92 TRINITY_DN9300_c0_g1_i1:12-1241(-)
MTTDSTHTVQVKLCRIQNNKIANIGFFEFDEITKISTIKKRVIPFLEDSKNRNDLVVTDIHGVVLNDRSNLYNCCVGYGDVLVIRSRTFTLHYRISLLNTVLREIEVDINDTVAQISEMIGRENSLGRYSIEFCLGNFSDGDFTWLAESLSVTEQDDNFQVTEYIFSQRYFIFNNISHFELVMEIYFEDTCSKVLKGFYDWQGDLEQMSLLIALYLQVAVGNHDDNIHTTEFIQSASFIPHNVSLNSSLEKKILEQHHLLNDTDPSTARRRYLEIVRKNELFGYTISHLEMEVSYVEDVSVDFKVSRHELIVQNSKDQKEYLKLNIKNLLKRDVYLEDNYLVIERRYRTYIFKGDQIRQCYDSIQRYIDFFGDKDYEDYEEKYWKLKIKYTELKEMYSAEVKKKRKRRD